MGVGYTVSALQRIERVDWGATPSRAAKPGEDTLADALTQAGLGPGRIVIGSVRIITAQKATILAWRDAIESKYRTQIGPPLSWDEDSAFVMSEDVATGDDVSLRYVAAVLDQGGIAAVAALSGTPKPDAAVMRPVFDEAERPAFGGRFPQLLLRVWLWLPFERHLIIEEPDWNGRTGRFGSSLRLADEVATIRAAIAGMAGDGVVQGAWRASAAIDRVGKIASAQTLPLWTTG